LNGNRNRTLNRKRGTERRTGNTNTEPRTENRERQDHKHMDATLEVVKREGRGKNEANRLRASGKIPGIVYGARKDGEAPLAISVAVDPKALLKILHSDSGANTLISLTVAGSESRVMVKEYQLDPVTHALLHADF